MMMPCSTTSSQPQRPTPPPHLDQRGRSGRTPLPAHLQLGLEKHPEYKRYSARLTRLNKQESCKAQVKALRLSNYYISMSFLEYLLAKLVSVARNPQIILVD